MACIREHCMRLPLGKENKVMVHNTECLYFTVTVPCTWCYKDPCNAFNSTLPADQSTLLPGLYGPYTPVNPTTPGKEVSFDAVAGIGVPCVCTLVEGHHGVLTPGPHTITVG